MVTRCGRVGNAIIPIMISHTLKMLLHTYNANLPTLTLSIIRFIVFAALTAFMVYGAIVFETVRIVFGIAAIVFFVFTVLCLCSILNDFNHFHDKDTYVWELQQKMDNLEKAPSDNREAIVAESMKRLRNPDYLDMLSDHGIEIPDYFLNRINHRQEFKKHQDERQHVLQSDLDTLKNAQEKWRLAQRYLSMGKTNQNFKAVAEKLGMTVDEYSDYCHQIIEDYEEMHRQYNLTHSYPAEFPTLDDR